MAVPPQFVLPTTCPPRIAPPPNTTDGESGYGYETLPPIKAGIGNLEIGMDFIITNESDAGPDIGLGVYSSTGKTAREAPQDQEQQRDSPGMIDDYQIIFQEAVIKQTPDKGT